MNKEPFSEKVNNVGHNKSFNELVTPGMTHLYINKFQTQANLISVLMIAQIFAILPLTGLNSKDVFNLKFKFKSIRTGYSLLIFILLSIYSVIIIIWALQKRISFDRITPVLFSLITTFIILCFIQLAKKWPNLMIKWMEVERTLPKFENGKVSRKIKFISLTVMILSSTEYLLEIIHSIYVVECINEKSDKLRIYFIYDLKELFSLTEYSIYSAIFAKFLDVVSTFIWNFMDLFVMLVSVGLSTNFKQLNGFLFKLKGKQTNEEYWKTHRNNYRNLSKLCSMVDDSIGVITMISFSSHIYFICVQLLNTLK